jgi:hypothetical protein
MVDNYFTSQSAEVIAKHISAIYANKMLSSAERYDYDHQPMNNNLFKSERKRIMLPEWGHRRYFFFYINKIIY